MLFSSVGWLFQFTPLREGRPSGQQKRQQPADFNSRPSARGDRRPAWSRDPAPYFNSRPSARGDTLLVCNRITVEISIHAPPRGATNRESEKGFGKAFQFTPLREGRHKAFVDKFKPKLFQFTPLREGRLFPVGNYFTPDVFQFTPLREGRRQEGWRNLWNRNFNSRPSARGDPISIALCVGQL